MPGSRARIGVLALALLIATPTFARAQSWRGWAAAPDSLLPAALNATGPNYETVWNDLVLAELRARLALADSARALFALELRVSRAERTTMGTRIAPDAMRLRTMWTRRQWRTRVRAAVAESLAAEASADRRFARADSLLRAARADYLALGEKRRAEWVAGDLGTLWLVAGDPARADSMHRETLAARRALGAPRLVARTMRDLALTSVALGHRDSCESWYRHSIAVSAAAGDSVGASDTMVDLTAFLRRGPRGGDVRLRRETAVRADERLSR